jgi:pimeloyl-ACP methyl ester carboxylesterase/DNA-binding winged helix-turn-helix (wHTH) protein
MIAGEVKGAAASRDGPGDSTSNNRPGLPFGAELPRLRGTTMSSFAYQFGDWLIEPALNRVSRREVERHLEPLAMDVLVHMLEHPGATLSVDHLLEAVWAGRVVEPNAVHRAIRSIRNVLDDDSRQPRYIETITKRGYRAVAAVERVTAAATVAGESRSADETQLAPPKSARQGRRSAFRLWPLVIPVPLIAAVLAFIGYSDVRLWWDYNAPGWLAERVPHEIRFARTADGVRIAYAVSGHGPPLVLVVGWFTHLEQGPVFDAPDIVNALSREYRLVRYDGRGFGMSDRSVTATTLDERVRDLEAVISAIGTEPVALLAVSKGTEAAVSYAARHPHKVASLIIAGGSLGIAWTGLSPEDLEAGTKMIELIRFNWDAPAVRSMLSDSAAPLSGEPQRTITEFLRLTGSGPAHADFMLSSAEADVSGEARLIRQPTLLLAGRYDQIAPIEYVRSMASLMPHAELKIIDTSHIDTARSREAVKLVLDFLRRHPIPDGL